ncbi:transporter substrate-binding domain-containing protein [Spirochaeta africana]|uniref:Periplasmic component of amino acid ABC-type transporter/signal transduction system n=1 Tax=Spirochaeta africana (strain ATCC 700263 / DSM 8902 / Z-7692) TaxID=889378 RepID=H9UHE6_SPIAZ|nr:transporter substrate-binding domain-containing protein [Spirochaeta africana]AFG36939.1 periplasmic component of amino acid ABC-type transporter/signal transduction system [Spirochaeta africana DSM 8902]
MKNLPDLRAPILRYLSASLLLALALSLLTPMFASAAGQPESDVLKVGMDLRYPPFETRDQQGNPEGISVDLATAFGEYIGQPVRIVDTNFASLIPALNAGDIDVIIASMSRTPERARAVEFSDTYLYFKIISLVNRDFAETHGITEDSTTDDLTSLEATRFTGITGQVSASIPQSLGFDVEVATNLESAVLNVVQGSADVLMMSAFPVTRGHMANPEDTIVVWDPFESSPIAMGFRQDSLELKEQANAFIAGLAEPGGVYDQLAEKWDDTIRERLGRYGLEFFLTAD